MKKQLRVALVAGLFLAGAGLVSAYAGMWTGLPAATSSPSTGNATTIPLTGSEVGAFDTGLSGGRNPQTETISVDQIKTYVFGNGGTVGVTGNTTAVSVAGAATCNAARCVVTTESLTTGAGLASTINISDNQLLSTSLIQVTLGNGTNVVTGPHLTTATVVCSGTNCAVRAVIRNANTIALSGTMVLNVLVIN